MKTFLLTAFLLLTIRDAFAIKRPTTPDELLLVQQLQAGINQILLLKSGIAKLYVDIKKEEDGIAGPNPAIVAGYRQQLTGLEDQQLILCNKAIKLAIKAYDLTPARPTGVLVIGAVGRQVNWVPVFVKLEGRYIQDAKGESRFVSPPSIPAAGITWPDGAITLTTAAFTSPGMLAAIILHETVHFEQRTTPGVGDKISPKQMEMRAHMAMLSKANELGLTTAESLTIQAALQKVRTMPESGYFLAMPGPSEARPEPIKSGGDDGFLSGIRDLEGVTDEIRQTVRRNREAAESLRIREKEERRLRVDRWFEDRKRSRDYMWGLAGQACSNPESMAALQERGEIIQANMDPLDDSYGLTETSGPGSLSSCQRSVLDRIDSARHRYVRIFAADFAEAARAYRREHPTLGERLGKFFEGIFKPYESLAEGRRDGPVVEPGEVHAPRSYSREPRCFVDSNGIRACCIANCD